MYQLYRAIISLRKKQRNQSQRIINLFQSCYAFLKFSKTRKKINRTSSDQLDKKKQKKNKTYIYIYIYIYIYNSKVVFYVFFK